MANNKIQSLVTVQAIKDFLSLEFVGQAETKKKSVVAIINELNKGEIISLKMLDSELFDNKFIPFITEMDYSLDLEFVPVKAVFDGLTNQQAKVTKTPHQKVKIKIQIDGAIEPIIDGTYDSDGMFEWYGEKLPLNLYLSNVLECALAIQNGTK
ncbi:hypothetical protein [Vibrio cholerae]|uniref:Uncharacterized protein n=1 Tax=Vibrio cholerae TaxID=666 RepID=A0ABD7SR73_VIBCL|nr:hypothetical protein [Vibrio cholerae]ELO1828667.1 hypothetical protein [Vibrio cholerae]KFE28813.1 hypothetical protein DN30_309 [Vibrio cholerae]MDX5049959.1 hypothetical protein [Vibrio cholerae]TXX67253.1 hypothetical protein FXF03_01380 [Vibrio cholerae]TXY44020.1 hypothetical protein FXE84_01390 [Vibrio cholerae]